MYAIAIHGGAGTVNRATLTFEQETAYRRALEQTIRSAHAILEDGGSSLDAVTEAVVQLENDPLFNAGYGAVMNEKGEHELDAAIMNGATLQAGCVAGVKRIKNPILAARSVMEKTHHVMLSGEGADALAEKQGLTIVEPEYFSTDKRRRAFNRMQEKLRINSGEIISDEDKHGTVGAVALDSAGNVAAATSTGGHTHKMVGRIGDSPIIGAGTYADNQTCAVSCTGDGEYFIRIAVAHEVASRMRYLNESVHDAGLYVVTKTLLDIGGSGGLIAIDRNGNIAMLFNTIGMYRAAIDVSGKLSVGVYKN